MPMEREFDYENFHFAKDLEFSLILAREPRLGTGTRLRYQNAKFYAMPNSNASPNPIQFYRK
jgi:hypothetical protein